MKKVNLKAYLIAAFCLIVFAGFTLAQTESAELGDVAKTDGNEIELARQKKHLQLQKKLMLKRWRQLKPGMTEKQVQKILGRPKLIQGGSPECVWFYQFLPVSVGGVKDGCVFFKAKSLDSLINEEKSKHDKIIAEEKARCDRAIAIQQARCVNDIAQITARPPANEAMRRMQDTAIAARKAMRGNAIAQLEVARNIAIRRVKSKYNRQVKLLRDRPRSPVFALNFFNQPDWDRFEELLADKKPRRIKPQAPIDKWKMSLSWRKLRINMKPGKVRALLGEPERIKTSVEGRREYYGDAPGHGELYFTARPDLEEYLHSWREPFWPAVEKELALSPRVEQEKVAMPEYSVLNEDVYDIPLKTQVELNILVSGEISETGLKALLEELYSSTKAKKGFKYHDSPTNIYIYAFTSKERAESGMGQWIAMLQESPGDLRPRISINKRQVARLSAEPEEKFGLSEAKRIEIWKEYVLAEDRAWKEAEERYPLDPTQALHVGQVFELSKETPLMPELEPADPMAALQRMRRLPSRTTITVVKVSTKHFNPWYYVEATSPSGASLGSGWINSIALMGQGQVHPKKQLEKQVELKDRLKDKYKDDLAKKYGLIREQLEKISTEGFEKDWPIPSSKKN